MRRRSRIGRGVPGAQRENLVRAVLDAGFVFWGLFLVSALIVVAYLVWMLREDRREKGP